MNVYQELKARGFIYQETDGAAIEKKLCSEQVAFYVGFDPTGNSLHVGHLLPVMAMRLLQRAGHIPVVLVGGATAQIGDPSCRSSARVMLTRETVAQNAQCLKNQLSHFISIEAGSSHFVDNNDWFKDMLMLDFLRDVGSRFSINRMLAQDSVKSRLENGLSYLEFSYSLLQGYDFYHLNRNYNCTMEMGGQDQWGNMVAGTELVRRLSDEKTAVHCLTIPLLMDPTTNQKFGKTAGGKNVWLDPERTSQFDYYQFWRNCDDGQVHQLLCYFSTLPVEEIKSLVECGNINRAKEILAYEATTLAHGEESARKSFLAAGTKFGFADPENKIHTTSKVAQIDIKSAPEAELPTVIISKSALSGDGIWIAKLLVDGGICKSTSDARRLIQGGAVAIDDEKINDVSFTLKSDWSKASFILKGGKKNFKKIVIK